jgi:hypothetical protein
MKRKWEIHENEGYSQDIIENKGAGTLPSDDTQCGWSTPALSASAGPRKGSNSRSQEMFKNEGCSQWLIEKKGPKKVLPMTLRKQTSYRFFPMSY